MGKTVSLIQCCGAETICFGSSSGSDFQKVSAPALAWPGAGAETSKTGSIFGSGQRFRLVAASEHCSDPDRLMRIRIKPKISPRIEIQASPNQDYSVFNY
jgi:hypothetical protein